MYCRFCGTEISNQARFCSSCGKPQDSTKRAVTNISDHKMCENNPHHFTDLKHFTGGSECRCKKCGLVVKFNRGWPDRIEPSEMDEFMQKYKGSNFDF